MKVIDFIVLFSILVGMLIAYLVEINPNFTDFIKIDIYLVFAINALILTLMIILSYKKIKKIILEAR